MTSVFNPTDGGLIGVSVALSAGRLGFAATVRRLAMIGRSTLPAERSLFAGRYGVLCQHGWIPFSIGGEVKIKGRGAIIRNRPTMPPWWQCSGEPIGGSTRNPLAGSRSKDAADVASN